ncbi:type VII secretion protein EssB [Pseudogracilibacillus auburnensis]|uniref:Type VII secretion protein EssB n=1 Tax=Pseudogracilibacillus auburnensis TaxID=1494959 RepID=A0A2V3VX91_9BACI|nr:type VII secretion protein EssB [Pseudogracilibacillus auburnensis]PXW86200.1 type VII secretion protein EssB [Pseudogracilibacillus auburnensis]
MKETEVKIDPLSLSFSVQQNSWKIRVPKSKTQVQYTEQLALITKETDLFVPFSVNEEDDAYLFSFTVERTLKKWAQMKKANKNEKLRALCNLEKLYQLMSTRVTFMLHPNNIGFNDNLMPLIIYRGIRGLVEPFEMTEEDLLKQFKCYSIALFSKDYHFDELYNGSLQNAKATKFEREINSKETNQELIQFLKNSYREEQQLTEKKMQLVPKKRFTLFKHMSIWMSVLSVLVISLLFYMTFVKLPYQDKLLVAHNNFLASDYSEVIQTLKNENVEKLPYQSKYILAYSYINVEQLSDREKETIMKNISLKSDKYYLLYWIYNGLGDFEQSIDVAKYMDDPQLIMYGLIKKMEQVKNDPDLTGSERDEEVSKLRDQLDGYTDEFDLLEEDENEEQEIDANEVETIEEEENAEADDEKETKIKDENKNKNKEKKKDK